MAKEFFILLVSPASVCKDLMLSGLDYQRPKSENYKIIFIGTVNTRPEGFWNNSKHCSTIDFEIGNVEKINFHVSDLIIASLRIIFGSPEIRLTDHKQFKI
jgi:hypothetical protein